MAIALVALAPTPWTFGVLGSDNPNLYLVATYSYVVLALFWLITTRRFQHGFFSQLYFQFATDVTLITLTMHASGGLKSGLGILLVVSIAGACMLVRGITPYFLAAIATLVILLDNVYIGLFNSENKHQYALASATGTAFFGTAFLSSLLSRRLEESETLASQRRETISNLEQVNELIVEQFQNGIIVIDKHDRIQIINQKASLMLGTEKRDDQILLHHISEELADAYEDWQLHPEQAAMIISQPGSAYDIQPSFITLASASGETLITLTDVSDLSKEMQAQKLASLGRLTASIAHEIRNPLSAINHAAQLLDESPDIAPEDSRMTHIITEQSQRLNRMVENIMQLSRKHQSRPEPIKLADWLHNFRSQFCAETYLAEAQFTINADKLEQTIQFDPSQLHQILWNLCANSMKYGCDETGECHITIEGVTITNTLCLDVYDNGSGIDLETASHIFEPFYTTHSGSSGLGLYISHELCAFNRARLSYTYNEEQQGRFRITLPTL